MEKTVRGEGFETVSRKRVWEWQNQEVGAYRLEKNDKSYQSVMTYEGD